MKKEKIQPEIKSIRITTRFSPSEYATVKQRAAKAGVDLSTFYREMALNGKVEQLASPYDLEEVRSLREALYGCKGNFARISNLIKDKNPSLDDEVGTVKYKIENILKKYRLW